MKTYLTKEQIVRIYFDKRAGHSNKEIALDLNIPIPTVPRAYTYIKEYWSSYNIDKKKQPVHAYVNAVKEIKGRIMNEAKEIKQDIEVTEKLPHVFEEPVEEKAEDTGENAPHDPLMKLENIFNMLQEEIVAFVEHEVAKKVGEVKKENEELFKEVKDLRVLKEEAKKSNFVGSLRKKFGYEKVKEG